MEKRKKLELEECLTEKDCLKKFDIKIVILSRGRADCITTTKLLPDWVEVVCPVSEKTDYLNAIKNPLILIPDDVVGLGKVRNWCLKNFSEETIIMIDDDIIHFYCLTGEKTKQINDKEEIIQIFINTAVMAKEAGAKVFGFSQSDIRKFSGADPFNLRQWVGTIIGIIGRKYKFRDDMFKVDLDMCLQNWLVERICWEDGRYFASNKKDNNKGGNSIFRTEKKYSESISSLKEKWGECIDFKNFKSQKKIVLNFKRKQNISI